ncbi:MULTISPECIES: type II secretion system F family protein [unclassified Turicibacter]|uniref:type II secretion system F family protein n=1 Tax=unclassified Turicibacter TaxID=2638206 RepID=UPI001379E9BE|nr:MULTISPECIES: type II secretion system F family protein [unclassified Turicibacter]MCU7203695.1 type II secretion system F family protein [Turicibacter sp. TA25]NCE78673.1 type II secretion system F family protein [Turicibacter sp. TS3]
MAKFRYRALTATKEKVEGFYVAKSKDEVISILVANNHYPLLVEEVNDLLNTEIGFKKKVKLKDIAIFCRQFYTMVDAGVKLDSCLHILATQLTHSVLKQAVADVHNEVKNGTMLSKAMNHHSDVFPNLLVKMISAGEISGNLDVILLRMSTYYEKENKVSNKIKSAMIYPTVLASVATVAVMIILTYVMPTFIEMFNQNGVELPLLTKGLLAVSSFLSSYFFIVMGVSFVVIFLFRLYSKTDQGYYRLSQFKLWAPILKPLNEKIVVARFTRTISTLLAGGIPIAQGIQMTSEVVQNKLVEDKLTEVKEKVIKGEIFSHAIRDSGVFPSMLASMINIGEQTGSLDDILHKTADFYEDELEAQIQMTTALVEPLMIVAMGIIIGVIVMAIMIPMFEMYTQL